MKRIILMMMIVLTAVSYSRSDEIVLSTTTSVRDSGLMDYLLPKFTKDTGYKVKLIAVGTGKALKMASDGEADALVVHAKEAELKFMANGDGIKRKEIAYNYFYIVGPKDINLVDQSGVEGAMKEIHDKGYKFVSRGDDSGTDKKERAIWKKLGITPSWDGYIETGSGMANTLRAADELGGFTLTDSATYTFLKDKLEVSKKIKDSGAIKNTYSALLVDPTKNKYMNKEGGEAFYNWMTSEKTRELIKNYRVKGKSIFFVDGM